MGDNDSVSGPTDPPNLSGGRSMWELPPSEWRGSEHRVAVSVTEVPDVWSTAAFVDPTIGGDSQRNVAEMPVVATVEHAVAETPFIGSPVEWSAIVEDLQSDLAEVPVVDPTTEVGESVDDAAVEVPAEVDASGFPGGRALLTIGLGPAFPGNVHVYEIVIDPNYGTFTGVAGSASNIAGETISGAFSAAFSAGNTDIDFTAVYPAPAYDYAWFGTGPLDGFTGGDSLGNVMDALSATLTLSADEHDGEVVGDPHRDDEWTPVAELVIAAAVVDLSGNETDGPSLSEPSPAVVLVADAMREAIQVPVVAKNPDNDVVMEAEVVAEVERPVRLDDDLSAIADMAAALLIKDAVEVPVGTEETDVVVGAEAEVVAEVPVVADTTDDVAVTEPEVAVEVLKRLPFNFDCTLTERLDDVRDHAAGCQCLPCRWAGFKPAPVTDGPFAGKAFYYGASPQVLPDEQLPATEGSAPNNATADHSETRAKRRSGSRRSGSRSRPR